MKQISYAAVGKMKASPRIKGWFYIIDSNNQRLAINNKVLKFKTLAACQRRIMWLYKIFRAKHVRGEL